MFDCAGFLMPPDVGGIHVFVYGLQRPQGLYPPAMAASLPERMTLFSAFMSSTEPQEGSWTFMVLLLPM